MTPQELKSAIDRAIRDEDDAALAALQSEFVTCAASSAPFSPAIELKDPAAAAAAAAAESAVAIPLANAIERGRRWLKYKVRRAARAPRPYIVSEGDSWFQYPFFLRDTIDDLLETRTILSLGAAGDTLANMLASGEYLKAVVREKADMLLISASGNDVLGDGDLEKLLRPWASGMTPADALDDDRVEATLAQIENGFERIITDTRNAAPGVTTLFHGYDRPIPRKDGRWLGAPLAARRIPRKHWREIIGVLFDRLNQRLYDVAERHRGAARYVNCRGLVGDAEDLWHDELHPRDDGYARVADAFDKHIKDVWEERRRVHGATRTPETTLETTPETPPETPQVALTTAGDDSRAGRGARAAILARAERPGEPLQRVEIGEISAPLRQRILDDFEELLRNGQRDGASRIHVRESLIPEGDATAYERTIGESNLFPVNYLSRGARKARAVAKIQLYTLGEIPAGSGSGFLVGPGLMLTNNHVVDSRETARRAQAMFDYQVDDRFQPMPVKSFELTDEVFFTSPAAELDFTFVSVAQTNAEGQSLAEFGEMRLIPDSGKALKDEEVSIIQHPDGALKKLVLHDSRILGVRDDFIYYTSDTEPGSSGAPVLNDQWLPVALHHQSVPDPTNADRWIANRGIRISSIIAAVRKAAKAGDEDARAVLDRIRVSESLPKGAPAAPSIARAVATHGDVEAAFAADRWRGVAGYDPKFLGGLSVPLPLPDGGRGVREIDGRPDLTYRHFSIVMHADRKLAMATACNVDGAALRPMTRRGRWRLDPRLPEDAQTGNGAYVANDYDRGHLTRRTSPMWGSDDDAQAAQADTFHFTNSAPQHARLNQRVWLELENYLLDWAGRNRARMSIFTGPIFRADDPLYRNLVRIPADYWKIAVAEDAQGPRAVGYLHTQKNLIPRVEEAFGEYRTHRTPIHVLAELTGLDFSALAPFDAATASQESARPAVSVIGDRNDIGFV